jgi:hypothetical protein
MQIILPSNKQFTNNVTVYHYGSSLDFTTEYTFHKEDTFYQIFQNG